MDTLTPSERESPTPKVSRLCPSLTLGAAAAEAISPSSISALACNAAEMVFERALRRKLRLACFRATMSSIAPLSTTFDSSCTCALRTSDGDASVAPPAWSMAASTAASLVRSLLPSKAAVAGARIEKEESTAWQVLFPLVGSGKGRSKEGGGGLPRDASFRRQNGVVGDSEPLGVTLPSVTGETNCATRAASARSACGGAVGNKALRNKLVRTHATPYAQYAARP
jgi:hypothetical protein